MAVALGLHGLRVGEVCRARMDELFVAGRVLHVPPFKRGRERDLPLHESLVAALLEWRQRERRELLLYTRSGNQVHRTQFERTAARLVAEVLGEPVKFHSLRHTFAMRVYAETRDLFLVQRLLGHKSVKSTEVYAASLAELPDACLVKLDVECESMSQTLKLYNPAG